MTHAPSSQVFSANPTSEVTGPTPAGNPDAPEPALQGLVLLLHHDSNYVQFPNPNGDAGEGIWTVDLPLAAEDNLYGPAHISFVYQARGDSNPFQARPRAMQGFTYGEQVVRAAPFIARTATQFTRPADVIAYAAGDVIGDNAGNGNQPIKVARFIYTSGLPDSMWLKEGILDRVRIALNANQALDLAFDLFIWFDDPGFAAADNTPFLPGNAIMNNLLGVVSFAATDVIDCGASGVLYQRSNLGIYFTPGNALSDPPSGYASPEASSYLYFTLVARNAYIPTLSEIFTVYFMGTTT